MIVDIRRCNRNTTLVPFIITSTTLSITWLLWWRRKKGRKLKNQSTLLNSLPKTYEKCIGNTPLLHLPKLSSKLGKGTNVYVKMECFNPGGTGKDRAALYMLRHAEANGDLPQSSSIQKDEPHTASIMADNNNNNNINSMIINSDSDSDSERNQPSTKSETTTKIRDITDDLSSTIKTAIQRSTTGGVVIEGTSGSTGISLSTLSKQRGHSTIIVMPDDQSQEKQTILKCLGAILHVVPTAAISNPNHYVNVARKIAEEINRKKIVNGNGQLVKAAFMNQFENEANYKAHYATTGPEIYEQTKGKIDVFCMSSGTGGTISGVGQFLKENCDSFNNQSCKVVLVDPPGSALYNKVKYNIAFTSEQRERALLRHRYDTIAEGIGLDRITHNFALGVDNGVIDDAVQVSDQNAVDMAHWLLKEEGLFVGSSSAMNVVGAVQAAVSSSLNEDGNNKSEQKNNGRCIVTVICDGGQRHLTRFWNREFITKWKLEWPGDDEVAWKNRLSLIFSKKSTM